MESVNLLDASALIKDTGGGDSAVAQRMPIEVLTLRVLDSEISLETTQVLLRLRSMYPASEAGAGAGSGSGTGVIAVSLSDLFGPCTLKRTLYMHPKGIRTVPNAA